MISAYQTFLNVTQLPWFSKLCFFAVAEILTAKPINDHTTSQIRLVQAGGNHRPPQTILHLEWA
jgi:hypothetical protein